MSYLEKRIRLLEEKLALYHRALYTALVDLEAKIKDRASKEKVSVEYLAFKIAKALIFQYPSKGEGKSLQLGELAK